MTILPTHTCFDDAIEFIEAAVRENPRLAEETLRLVHGICIAGNGPLKGRRFAHGWVEDGDSVWASGLLDGQKIWFETAKIEFYDYLSVEQVTRYTLRAMVEANLRSQNFGPWRPEYRALCRNAH